MVIGGITTNSTNKASQCRLQAGWIRKLDPAGRRYAQI